MSHDSSHSQLQLPGFQTNLLSHLSLSLNSSLHSHLGLSSFRFCLLIQTVASNLHLHLKIHAILWVFFEYQMTSDGIF